MERGVETLVDIERLPSRRDLLRWGAAGFGMAVATPAVEACGSGATSNAPKTGVVTWASSDQVRQLDPQKLSGNQVEQWVYNMLFDFLTRRDANFKLIPGVATSWTQPSPTTWRFKIRSDVKFHNGDQLTADDVKFSFDRIINPSTKSAYASTYAIVDSIAVVDPTTVAFTTKAPDALFPERFAWFPAWLLPQKYFNQVGADGFNSKPVGSGPYKFVELVQGTRFVAAAFDSYWGGRPAATQIVVLPRPEPAARVASLQSGEANFIDRTPVDQIDAINSDPKTTVTSISNRSQWILFPNVTVAPLDKVEIRQAMTMAIDRQSIVKNLLRGQGRPSRSMVVPGSFAYDPKAPVFPYDPEKARSLLKSAGYSGQAIELAYSQGISTPQDAELCQAIAAGWKSVGLNITLSSLETGAFISKLTTKAFKGLFYSGVSDSIGDPSGSLWRAMKQGGAVRYWTNAEFDRLGAEAESSQDQNLRLKDYQRMIQLMTDEVAWMPVFERVEAFGHTRKINFNPGITDLWSAPRLKFQ